MAEGDEAIDNSILVQWLRDSGRKAAFAKAIRAILATPGQEMMYDPPRGIYEDAKALPKQTPITGDVWGGNVLLTHRIELVSMVSIAYFFWQMKNSDIPDVRTGDNIPGLSQAQGLSRGTRTATRSS